MIKPPEKHGLTSLIGSYDKALVIRLGAQLFPTALPAYGT